MADYGVSDKGFYRKRLDKLLEELNNKVIGVFGSSINLNPESPEGQINGIFAEVYDLLWQLSEIAYNAFDPNKARGIILDNLMAISGISRIQATASNVELALTGDNGTVIPQGSIVRNSDGTEFITIQDAVIELGIATAVALSVELGEISAPADTLITIVTPVAGWTSVNNPLDAVEGRELEKDEEARIRRKESVAFPSQAKVDAIYSAIANLDGVTSVTVLENFTDVIDGNGLLPHSTHAIVAGGLSSEIAEAIFNNKSAGINTNGAITENVNDIQGYSHEIKFTRPTETPIYIIVNLTTIAGVFPITGADDIANALVEYANLNFEVGDDIIQSRLYTPVNETPGHDIDSILIGISSPPTLENNIIIPLDEIGKFEKINIIVNA